MRTALDILVFPDAEVLDVMGPYEAFSLATHDAGGEAFDVRLVAHNATSDRVVALRNGLRVVADRTIDTRATDASVGDGILLVPGGPGVRRLLDDAALHRWIGVRAREAQLVLSVCTGAWLLGLARLLDGVPATTHHQGFDDLARIAPTCDVRRGARFVDAGRIKTSAGVSAGIDLSLHVIAERLGAAARDRVTTTMEWPHD
ncbi:MAG: DJ-1/PfpI family protein [Phycisphaerae bacterium]|nr:DJ-1/PfpI family protein [Phycisphaerae bacterium]